MIDELLSRVVKVPGMFSDDMDGPGDTPDRLALWYLLVYGTATVWGYILLEYGQASVFGEAAAWLALPFVLCFFPAWAWLIACWDRLALWWSTRGYRSR